MGRQNRAGSQPLKEMQFFRSNSPAETLVEVYNHFSCQKQYQMKTNHQKTNPFGRSDTWIAISTRAITLAAAATLYASAPNAEAVVPAVGQFVPVAVYHDM